MIDPEVSVPMPIVARFAPTAMPGSELDPPVASTGRPSSKGGSFVPGLGCRGSMRGSYELKPKPTFFGCEPPSATDPAAGRSATTGTEDKRAGRAVRGTSTDMYDPDSPVREMSMGWP